MLKVYLETIKMFCFIKFFITNLNKFVKFRNSEIKNLL